MTALSVVATALLAAYLAVWAGVDRVQVGRSDFTSTYVGATLLRQGQGARLYDESLQEPLHSQLIAPDHEGNLPYVNPPAAAAVAVPFSLLPLAAAYRLWSLLQLLLLAAAVAVAVRAVPRPEQTGAARTERAAIALVALAGLGTASLLVLGQWDGLGALGVALAYADWRRGQSARGAAWLAVTAAVAKPHLALGLAAFVLGRRDRRMLTGAAVGVGAVALASLAVAGPAGCAAFVRAAAGSTGRWPLRSLLGFTGLFGSWLGDATTAHALAAAATVVAVIACGWLGAVVRHNGRCLDIALAGAVALSLVAAPHLLGHDLVLLAPAAAWMLARTVAADGAGAWPGRRGRLVLGLWLLVNLAAALDLGNTAPAPPGRLVPWALTAAGAAACLVCARWWRAAPVRPPVTT